MDKGYYEFLVKGKANDKAKAGKVICFILAILSVAGVLFMSSVLFIITAIAFGIIAYLLSGYTDVEYEYLFLEKELSIDRIYNQEKRKHVETLKLDKAQMFAPVGSSKFDNLGNGDELKITDYSTPGESGLKKYEMRYEGGRKIFFSLDDEMIKAFKSKCPRNFSEF